MAGHRPTSELGSRRRLPLGRAEHPQAVAVGVERDGGEAEIHLRRRLGDAGAERPPARDRHGDVRFACGHDRDLAAARAPARGATPSRRHRPSMTPGAAGINGEGRRRLDRRAAEDLGVEGLARRDVFDVEQDEVEIGHGWAPWVGEGDRSGAEPRQILSAARRRRGGLIRWTRDVGRRQVIGLDRAGEADRQQVALAVARLADRSADPALADAIFLDVVALAALEAHADAALERGLVVERARGIDAESVGRLVERLISHRRPQTKRRLRRRGRDQTASALTRLARREIFRDAAFLWTMPFWPERASSGSAARNASAAAAASLASSASSTLRTEVRIWLRRDLLTAVRRAILRTAFCADLVLAMNSGSFAAAGLAQRTARRRLKYNRGRVDAQPLSPRL